MKTIRQQLAELLQSGPYSAIEISQALSIPEKEVYGHLDHLSRSLARKGKKLVVSPYRCRSCGYSFSSRRRLSRPGRCPQCKKTHIQVALFEV